MAPTVLILPGWQNSGPEHWQTRWERTHPTYRRVEQRDWDSPTRVAWVAALDVAIAGADRPVVLVAHSLGCNTVVQWAAAHPERAGQVRAALLVAPPSPEGLAATPAIRDFLPMPAVHLPFQSMLVASDNDPYCALARAEDYAAAWGSRLVKVGPTGHINTEAGFGPWPAGEALLADLLAAADGAETAS